MIPGRREHIEPRLEGDQKIKAEIVGHASDHLFKSPPMVALQQELAELGKGDFVSEKEIAEEEQRQMAPLVDFVNALTPTDPVEAQLATQLHLLHTAMVALMGKLDKAEDLLVVQGLVNSISKLQSRYLATIEARQRHSSDNEQRILVQHVNLNQGTQIGSVQVGRGPSRKTEEEPHGDL